MRQQEISVVKAVALILLLYVLGLFISGFLSYRGVAEIWTEAAFRGTLAVSGFILFSARSIEGRDRESFRLSSSVPLLALFATGLVISEVSLLVARAASEAELRFAELPPFNVIAIQQVLAAVGEELLFTGFLFCTLRRRWGFVRSTALVTALFVLLHWPGNVTGVLSRCVYILAACSLFERSGSIALTIAMHLVVNGAGFLAVLFFEDAVPKALAWPEAAYVVSIASASAVAFIAIVCGYRKGERCLTALSSPASDNPSPG